MMSFAEPDSAAFDGRKYSEVTFAATHNSYSGGLMRDQVTLREQLDRGVRALELDIHDDNYLDRGFRVGHLSPGDEVFHGETNPRTDALIAWLTEIATWSAGHPAHAPITLLLDLKDDLSDKESFDEGDLFALNALLRSVFGTSLYSAEEMNLPGSAWPNVKELRGKIILVLSGDTESRVAYRGSRGARGGGAIDDEGRALAVHQDEDGALWIWSGERRLHGVRWSRREIFASGGAPAIELRPGGEFSARFQDGSDRYQRRGYLRPDGAIVWRDDEPVETKARGVRPSALEVFSAEDPAFGSDTLFFRVGDEPAQRMRPEQLAFVEVQHGNGGVLANDNLLFYSAPASDISARVWAATARATGKIARLWCFNDASLTAEDSVNFPATDLLFSRWYSLYENTIGCAR